MEATTPFSLNGDAGGPHYLPPLRTSSTDGGKLQRAKHSKIMRFDGTDQPALSQPHEALKRQESKGSIRGLFSRTKSTQGSGNDARLHKVDERGEAAEPPTIGATPLPPVTNTPTRTTNPPQSMPPSTTSKLKHKPSKSTMRSKSIKSPPPLRPITAWDPPPLFQAYPQAVRHACLKASSLSAESILRSSTNPRRGSLQQEAVAHLESLQVTQPARKRENKEKKHRRRISGSISKADWIQKIYVLVTSGYLLQYAGEGSFDRLPEKMMQLGKDSVAFASDAIPGKHWVLQISQVASDDGELPVEAPKSILSRLGFRGADARRAARSFLLILESAEELDAWLITVRREIEALGGRKCRPETPARQETTPSLHSRPSQRYLVKRDPNQFTRVRSREHAAPRRAKTFSYAESDSLSKETEDTAMTERSLHRQSIARRSTDAPSLSTTATSTDFEKLRDTSRYSYVSTGSKTMPSSRGSSQPSSPTKSTFMLPDLPPFDATIAASPNLSSVMGSNKHRSMQTPPPLDDGTKPAELRPSSQSPRPNSRHGTSSARSVSPGTPNFSVPTFSKRYSHNPLTAPPLPTPPRSAGTVHPSPSPSPPTVQEPSPDSAERKEERPVSVLGDLPAMSSGAPSPALSFSRRHSLRPSSSQQERAPHPKRLSSLEYSLGIEPKKPNRLSYSGHSVALAPPLPPPDMDLPALPVRSLSSHSNRASIASPAQPTTQVRRPISMQVRTDPSPIPQPKRSPSVASPTALAYSSSPTRPSFQPTRVSVSTSAMIAASTGNAHSRLGPRASMPDLSLRSPAPPPDCPLPEVPDIRISRFSSAYRDPTTGEHITGTRRSVDERRLSTRHSRSGDVWTHGQGLTKVSVV